MQTSLGGRVSVPAVYVGAGAGAVLHAGLLGGKDVRLRKKLAIERGLVAH